MHNPALDNMAETLLWTARDMRAGAEVLRSTLRQFQQETGLMVGLLVSHKNTEELSVAELMRVAEIVGQIRTGGGLPSPTPQETA